MKQILIPVSLMVLVSCNAIPDNTSEPLTVSPPVSKPSNRGTNDSSFLKIKIVNDNYEISFFNKTLATNTITELETFLQENKALINKDKVLVTGLPDSGKRNPFVNLLSRYGISKFYTNPN